MTLWCSGLRRVREVDGGSGAEKVRVVEERAAVVWCSGSPANGLAVAFLQNGVVFVAMRKYTPGPAEARSTVGWSWCSRSRPTAPLGRCPGIDARGEDLFCSFMARSMSCMSGNKCARGGLRSVQDLTQVPSWLQLLPRLPFLRCHAARPFVAPSCSRKYLSDEGDKW